MEEAALSPCPACDGKHAVALFNGTDRLYRTTTERFQVVRCSQCGLVRLDPWPDPAVLGRYYPADYWFAPDESAAGRMEEVYRRLVLSDHVRFVNQALQRSGESGPVLDVGCGGGLFLAMLRELGRPVLGLDLLPGAAAIAWKRQAVPAVCGNLAQPPLRPNSCAAVTMFHVLEHLYAPPVYLEAAHELLRPEGRLIVQVPNSASWQFLTFGAAWNGTDIPRHLFHFREKDLETLLDSCGFEVLRRKHFSWRDNPAGFATSLFPALDPMSRRVRHVPESPSIKLLKDLVYFAVVLAAVPFTVLEAACRAGATIMFEARKKR